MAVQMADHYELIDATKSDAPEYRHQVQGAMWITGFERWKYANYFERWKYANYYEGDNLDGEPQRKLHVVDIPRDDELIDTLPRRLRCDLDTGRPVNSRASRTHYEPEKRRESVSPACRPCL